LVLALTASTINASSFLVSFLEAFVYKSPTLRGENPTTLKIPDELPSKGASGRQAAQPEARASSRGENFYA
jgi:hypothetical protein